LIITQIYACRFRQRAPPEARRLHSFSPRRACREKRHGGSVQRACDVSVQRGSAAPDMRVRVQPRAMCMQTYMRRGRFDKRRVRRPSNAICEVAAEIDKMQLAFHTDMRAAETPRAFDCRRERTPYHIIEHALRGAGHYDAVARAKERWRCDMSSLLRW